MDKKNVCFKVILFIVSAMIIFTMNGYSFVVSNGSGIGYEGVGISNIGINSPIEIYVIQGAGYFLQSGSDIQRLLVMVELQDSRPMDFNTFDKVIACASANIGKAIETYGLLIRSAESTPYNEMIQSKLKCFDYDSFAQGLGLNKTVFTEVAGFLRNGDITGIYKRTYARLKEIASLLQTVKNDSSRQQLSIIPVFRRLNDILAETSLFGSYTAQVFSAII